MHACMRPNLMAKKASSMPEYIFIFKLFFSQKLKLMKKVTPTAVHYTQQNPMCFGDVEQSSNSSISSSRIISYHPSQLFFSAERDCSLSLSLSLCSCFFLNLTNRSHRQNLKRLYFAFHFCFVLKKKKKKLKLLGFYCLFITGSFAFILLSLEGRLNFLSFFP